MFSTIYFGTTSAESRKLCRNRRFLKKRGDSRRKEKEYINCFAAKIHDPPEIGETSWAPGCGAGAAGASVALVSGLKSIPPHPPVEENLGFSADALRISAREAIDTYHVLGTVDAKIGGVGNVGGTQG